MAAQLLWVDDEIEHLHAHILFLEKKGYDVSIANNGLDAIEQCQNHTFDLILLDEMMPGITGLETLQRIKEIQPQTPVVMVTKSEEEDIMDQAIGKSIADYLIKPVNPMQILLTLKKHVHQRDIVTEIVAQDYQQSFQDISMQIQNCRTFDDWQEVYKRLVRWELEIARTGSNMTEMLAMQKEEANTDFAKFVKKNYLNWMTDTADKPLMSNRIMPDVVFPALNNGEKVFFIVIDNFRYDQWRTLAEEIGDMFDIDERLYCSILPTATQYARNAIFSGLMPTQIAQMFPDLWVDEDEEEGKNINESPLIQTQLQRYRRKETFSYHKIIDSTGTEKLMSQFNSLKNYDLNVIVINFIDILSHARTITTDHGSIRCSKAVKIIGDRNTNTNLRYKFGKNLNCSSKDTFVISAPRKAHLPAPNISTTYHFVTGNDFFAYPNNYNYYVQYYKDTFQHGGISMEEMIIPIISMKGRKK